MITRTAPLAAALVLAFASALIAQNEYPLTADSQPQEGVPQGDVLGPFEWKSQVYPGTLRNYWLYVPKQYDASKRTCVLVLQDGLSRAQGWHLIPALDNLIHKGEIPVQIGIFIDHGV